MINGCRGADLQNYLVEEFMIDSSFRVAAFCKIGFHQVLVLSLLSLHGH